MFVIDITRKAATDKANKILKLVSDFMKSNLLHINIGKCCYMYFEPPTHYRSRMLGSCARSITYMRKADIPKIIIDGNIIKEVSGTKFLEVIIDNRLSWVPHIENLYKNSNLQMECSKESETTSLVKIISQYIMHFSKAI